MNTKHVTFLLLAGLAIGLLSPSLPVALALDAIVATLLVLVRS